MRFIIDSQEKVVFFYEQIGNILKQFYYIWFNVSFIAMNMYHQKEFYI